jgi:hypothetical protein
MPPAPDLLASLFSAGARPAPLLRHVTALKARGTDAPQSPQAAGVFVPPAPRRRTAIFDMHASVHCSIIGTCLSSAETRRILVKLGVPGAETAADHDVHKQGVALAGNAQGGGKVIQKALDRRHETVVKQFAKAADEMVLGRMWDDAVRRGDIPGAYWAVLSHPLATDALMRKAFGDVHMLSHLVGAANRADIRRLRELEEENAELQARLDAQQRHLRDGFIERDGKIRLLTEALGRALAEAPSVGASDDARAAREAIRDLERRLAREATRCARVESRLEAALHAQSEAESARRDAVRECEEMRRELALAETQIAGLLAENPDADGNRASVTLPLGGAQVLYVGGRAHQVPQLKALVEGAGGVLLHHDGGIEHSMTLLPGLVSRADCTVFPVDCISHDAMGAVKRQCRQAGKPFIPLRTSSLASLLAGLAMVERRDAGP